MGCNFIGIYHLIQYEKNHRIIKRSDIYKLQMTILRKTSFLIFMVFNFWR